MNYLTTKTYRPARLMSDMDRVFNQFFENSRTPAVRGFDVDIAEIEDGYSISANLPGFSAEDVDVRVEDNLLVIEARELEKTEEKNDEGKMTWYVRERRGGSQKRSFVLPEDVAKNGVEAEMKNGVLSVLLKKKPEAKPFSIKVKGK